MKTEKEKALARLAAWEKELHKTGKGNLSKFAPKVIKDLKEYIKRKWPEEEDTAFVRLPTTTIQEEK